MRAQFILFLPHKPRTTGPEHVRESRRAEPASGLEPLTCSLRVRFHDFTAVARCFSYRLHKPHLSVLRFWMFSDVRSGYCHSNCQSSVGNEIRLPPPRQVDAEENDHPTEDLNRCEILSKQQHPRGDPDQVNQVLVDQSSVGPHPRDTPLPRPEPEGGYQHRRVGERRPNPAPTSPQSVPQSPGRATGMVARPAKSIVREATTRGGYLLSSGKESTA